MDAELFFAEYVDHLAPTLDTYEQTVYLYVIRKSRLIGKNDAVIGFKSARKEMGFGIGQGGSPMSEAVCYQKLRNLESKGCVKIFESQRSGTRVQAFNQSLQGTLDPSAAFAAAKSSAASSAPELKR